MSDELHIMSLVTLLNAVHTDGVAICCVTGVTPVRTQIVFVNHKTVTVEDILFTLTVSININYL